MSRIKRAYFQLTICLLEKHFYPAYPKVYYPDSNGSDLRHVTQKSSISFSTHLIGLCQLCFSKLRTRSFLRFCYCLKKFNGCFKKNNTEFEQKITTWTSFHLSVEREPSLFGDSRISEMKCIYLETIFKN